MNNLIRNQLNPYLLDYLKKTVPDFQKKGKLFTCPICHSKDCCELTANEYPLNSGKVYCFNPNCRKKIGDIISICREIEFGNNKDVPVDDIANYIIDMFNIKINNHVSDLFDKYQKWDWDMVPVAKNDKASNIEKEWQNKSHKNRTEWESWYGTINMGVQTGEKSNITVIDFDFVESDLKKRIYEGNPTEKMLQDARKQWEEGLEKVKKALPFIDWTTVQQKGFGGIHLIYQYEKDIPKTNLTIEGIHVDIMNDGGQVVIEPSIVGEQKRVIEGDEIKKMPEELKKYILENSTKKSVFDNTPEPPKGISSENELTFENLNGNRNNTFIKLFGEMRKDSNIKVAERHLRMFNNLLDKKLPLKELKAMSREAEKYHTADMETIGEKIISHFKLVDDILHIRDLKEVLGLERKDIEEALRYLIDQNKVQKVKKDTYGLIQDVEWRTDFMTLSKPLDVQVPYFNKFANFNNGSMIVIAGKTGTGKTHLTVNIIERFVKQGICPKLITTEADSGVGEIAIARGLKEGDFRFWQTSDPLTVPFKQDEVRIIDWLTAKDGDYAKLGLLYQQLNDQLVNFGGLLIVLSQLRKDNNEFFCVNQIDQFSSLSAKFLYPSVNGQYDNLHPYFEISKIRRPKDNRKFFKVPLEYIPESKELRERT